MERNQLQGHFQKTDPMVSFPIGPGNDSFLKCSGKWTKDISADKLRFTT